ncbi:S10 family peptidase [Luteolibacter algae]|uniref:S10 family peptidase n=1 Tax=Luteolibacter algae TaxID=454151 RepID=A0ABW5DBH6_9BACT
MHPFYKSLLVVAFFSQAVIADDKAGTPPEKPAKEAKTASPVTKDGKIVIAGNEISYKSTVGKLQLRDDKGDVTASMFYTSYVKSGVTEGSKRPVMFAFNGGPGSSSVWLHIGILGPKRVFFPGDGTQPIEPPARLIDNDQSLLDVCDLVFIDPVSTGYSRAEKKDNEKDFHSLQSDISSVGDFIRMWVTENNRWASPKYLCGESYGGIRAAGLAEHLQDHYGMSLNGVVMLSTLLDYRTLIPSQGSQLSAQVYLPAFATTAHFHGKVPGDRNQLYKDASEFAFGEYGVALQKGTNISAGEKARIAAKLAALTGISAEMWERKNLELDPSEFRAELLRDEKKVIGRFDGRVAWDSTAPTWNYAEYDPSYSLALGAFSTAMLSYLGDDLGWKEDQPYEILTSVSPWKFNSDNRIVNVADSLATAMRDNPRMRVLVMGAYADLATPPQSMEYSLRQIDGFPDALRKNISFEYYEAGHMFYLNPPDLVKARKDLVEFIGHPQP